MRTLIRTLTLAVTVAGACSSPGDATTQLAGSSDRPAAAIEARPVEVELDVPALEWISGDVRSDGGRRVALLVAADEYAESAWNLRFAKRSAEEFRRVLVERLGFGADDVRLLTGDGVYARNVEGTLQDLCAGMSGPDNVLLTLWVGHGFEIGGEQRLLTFRSEASTSSADGGYTDTLRYEELTAWIEEASRAVRRNGGSLDTAMILDACRVETRAAPRRIVDHVSSVDVEAFSAPLGQPAPDAAADYTALVTRALDTARGARVSLLPALTAARDEIARRNPSASPEIASGDRDVVLFDRANLTVTVEAVDATSDPPRPIRDARIELNGEVGRVLDGRATFSGLAASDEGYDLRVLADGYFWRTAELNLPPERSGSTIRVGLLPEYVVLTGLVALPETGMAEVKVTGGFRDTIEGHHVTRTVVSRSGRWQLQVPREEGRRTLVVAPSGAQADVPGREFDLAEMHSTSRSLRGVTVSVYDFGLTTLDATGSEAIIGGGAMASAVGDVAVSFDLSSFGQADFADPNAQAFFNQIAPLVENGQFARAVRDMDTLTSQGRVNDAALTRFTAQRGELALADALAQAEQLRQRGDLSGAIDAVAASGMMGDPRVIPVYGSWLLADAADLHGRGEFRRAVDRLGQADAHAEAAGFDRETVRAQLRQAHRDWFEAAFEEGVERGRWTDAETALAVARSVLPDQELDDMAARMERENIPRECRVAYRRAVKALSRGDLEAAWTEFQLAAESGANSYYLGEIESQSRAVGIDLFAKNNRIGAERYQAGDMVGSFNAYLRAWEYDDLVQSRIEELLEDPAVQRAEARKVAEFPVKVAQRRWRHEAKRVHVALAEDRLDDALAILAEARTAEHADLDTIDDLIRDVEARRAERTARLASLRERALDALSDRSRWATLDRATVEALAQDLGGLWPELDSEFRFQEVRRHEANGSGHWMASFVHGATGLEFVLVPGGEAEIGSLPGERGRGADEGRHRETLGPYLMATTECTQQAWAKVGGRRDPSVVRGERMPVQSVGWRAAFDWCRDAGLQLPTEVQWEWACRAGTAAPFWTGADLVSATVGRSFDQGPSTVASHPANPFGLHDMHGNVAEWCANPYGEYGSIDWTRLGRERDNRVARGGGFNAQPDDARAASRKELPWDFDLKTLGFRPVRNLSPLP